MKVNGSIITLEKTQTLFDFLIEQNIDRNTIAIEYNGEIIPRDLYKNINLSDEDILEIVHFVGGG